MTVQRFAPAEAAESGRARGMARRFAAVLLVLVLVLTSCVTVFGAEADPNVIIVNPASDTPVTSGSLLISVKITAKESIVVNAFKGSTAADGTVTWSSVLNSGKFTSTSNLSFYTKKLENISVGTYLIRVDTLGADGSTIYQTSRKVTVKAKEAPKAVFTSGSTSFLQSLLISIFGN